MLTNKMFDVNYDFRSVSHQLFWSSQPKIFVVFPLITLV